MGGNGRASVEAHAVVSATLASSNIPVGIAINLLMMAPAFAIYWIISGANVLRFSILDQLAKNNRSKSEYALDPVSRSLAHRVNRSVASFQPEKSGPPLLLVV
jgi:hypothetical protein